MSEKDRVEYVLMRDGVDAAMEFCRQGLRQYRAALAERNSSGFRTGYGFAYRRQLVEACVYYRRYLRQPQEAAR